MPHSSDAAFAASANGQLLNSPPALASWVHGQLTMQPTLHRAYYRERVNPRLDEMHTIGHPRLACEVDARWRRFCILP